MRLLIVGSGAREHALAWKLRQSTQVGQLFVAPGNGGTAAVATNLPCPASDIEGLVSAAREHSIDLTVVGPELPLADGIVDRFNEEGLAIFGPTKAAARIEASKVFAKEVMMRHRIPCAKSIAFDSLSEAVRYVNQAEPSLVVKADGLAAGKGVTVCETREEAVRALREALEDRVFGSAGDRVLVEECLEGREVSVFAFTDGQYVSPLVAACDYKRAYDGDLGPNTGGMGGYSPPPFLDEASVSRVQKEILEATVHALAKEGVPYRGVLYGGLMLTREGPKVLEFNCRLGDPEAQVILPRLETDLLEVVQATLEGRLDKVSLLWSQRACVGVVMASGGYPGPYRKGSPISGEDTVDEKTLVFHGGTRWACNESSSQKELVTDGGRVLTVVGLGSSLKEARERAYAGISKLSFQQAFYRKDIALV